MANITEIWKDKKPVDPPDIQLRNAIVDAGLEPPNEIIFDGRIHRFASGSSGRSNRTDKSGWYVAFGDGICAGKFGDWRWGVEHKWIQDIGRRLTQNEEIEFARRMEAAKKAREESESVMRENVSEIVDKIWNEAAHATEDHPYLVKKQIKPHGARVTGDGRLIVPLYNDDGEMTTVQYIDANGGKLYHTGGKTGGSYWRIGADDDNTRVYLAEGYATAATIAETTSKACYVAYSASNIPTVVGQLRERYGPSTRIIIVADNDRSGVGKNHADQASAKYGATVIVPPIEGMDANDYLLAGNDLSALLEPAAQEYDWLEHGKDFRSTPTPISWYIKNWIQSNSLTMVHGPSGSGKTFLVLDWCLHLSAVGLENRDWCGNRTKHLPVVYLAGEGHHGLKGRVAAWMQHHDVDDIDFWMSKTGTDLNEPDGLLKVIENVRALPVTPKVIVVDTLHRFLNGDENSAQDAKTMLDSCAILMNEFDCTVMLVHHTGVSEEAQHRARGSSAWRGALDIEVSVKPGNDARPIEIIQRKMKDAEMRDSLFFNLKKVEISGWKDEDGEQVHSVVLESASAPAKVSKKLSRVEESRKRFERAWHFTNRNYDGGKPFVEKSGMLDFLTSSAMGMSESAARKACQNDPSRMIGILIDAKYIAPKGRGWVALDESLIMDLKSQCDNLGQ
jgi:phage/plasmid primase-like uncharacterized protein/archaellum biogenesis ATPase FlaH